MRWPRKKKSTNNIGRNISLFSKKRARSEPNLWKLWINTRILKSKLETINTSSRLFAKMPLQKKELPFQ